jgi:hypothetical protein
LIDDPKYDLKCTNTLYLFRFLNQLALETFTYHAAKELVEYYDFEVVGLWVMIMSNPFISSLVLGIKNC